VVVPHLGWVASEDWLLKAMDLNDTGEETPVAQLESVLRGIIAGNVLGESD
jgi:hypothetical protein